MWIDVPRRRRGSTVLRTIIKTKRFRRGFGRHVREGNERHAGGRGVSNEQATSSFNFRPAYASVFPVTPSVQRPTRIPLERGVAAPHRGSFRLPTDAAYVRLAQVAMETDEKRRPGLFETIIRRSIPLALVLCISLAAAPPPTALQSFPVSKNSSRRPNFSDGYPRPDCYRLRAAWKRSGGRGCRLRPV